jgi:hypothetical protein
MKLENVRMIVMAAAAAWSLLACQLDMEPAEGHLDDLDDVESISQGLSLGTSLGHNLASGSTCGLNNGVTPRCAPSNASDMTYEWTAPSSGTFTFTTTGAGTNFNTVLQIADYFSPSTFLGCNDNASASTTKSTLSLSLTSGKKILVAIDGYMSLCGNYQLGITKNCTSSCTSPPPCSEPQGTCTVNGTCSYVSLCDSSEICSGGECVPRCTIDPRFPC